MMGDPVPELPNPLKVEEYLRARLRHGQTRRDSRKDGAQMRVPDPAVLSLSEHLFPEREIEL